MEKNDIVNEEKTKEKKTKILNIYQKLGFIQYNIRAAKNLKNPMGFTYRNVESILESAKPLLQIHGLILLFEDDIKMHFDKVFIESTAILMDAENGEVIKVKGIAELPSTRARMDASQNTGSSVSYARKYALGALFLLDDNKDIDSIDNTQNIKDGPKNKTIENNNNVNNQNNNVDFTLKKALELFDNLESEKKSLTLEWLKVKNRDDINESHLPSLQKLFIKKV